VLHEALYFGDALQQSLWCPNQLRSNGIVVEDVPQQFDKTSNHSIYLPKQNIRLPLKMQEIVSYLPTRKPTTQELKECEWYCLTSDAKWEPYAATFARQEENITMSRNVAPRDPSARTINVSERDDAFKKVQIKEPMVMETVEEHDDVNVGGTHEEEGSDEQEQEEGSDEQEQEEGSDEQEHEEGSDEQEQEHRSNGMDCEIFQQYIVETVEEEEEDGPTSQVIFREEQDFAERLVASVRICSSSTTERTIGSAETTE
jgi:hypothetical protein